MTTPKRLFEPQSADELLRGWLLHCHKARDRHETAAREYDTWRYRLGVPVVALGAIVGTAVFASLGGNQAPLITIAVGIVSVTATVLAALQTFLDYPGRADRHRAAAVRYKGFIRAIEQALTDDLPRTDPSGQWIADIRERLDALEDSAPVVADNIWKRVEARYSGVEFVPTALALYNTSRQAEAAQPAPAPAMPAVDAADTPVAEAQPQSPTNGAGRTTSRRRQRTP